MSKQIQINGHNYVLFSWNEDHVNGIDVPHMIDVSTGRVPTGKQRELLREYLLYNGVDIEPWEKRNTHWCVETALRLDTPAQMEESDSEPDAVESYLSIRDAVNEMSASQDKDLLCSLLSGVSKTDVAASLGITIQTLDSRIARALLRIRQINNAKNNTKLFLEDKYRAFYSRYSVDRMFFEEQLHEPPHVFLYLQLVYERGSANVAIAAGDESLDSEIRRAVQKLYDKNYIIIGNIRLRKDKTDIDEDALRLFMTYKFSPKSFVAITGKSERVLRHLRAKVKTEGTRPWKEIACDTQVGERFRLNAAAYIASNKRETNKAASIAAARYKPKDSKLYKRLAKKINKQFDNKFYIGDIVVSDAEYVELLGFLRVQLKLPASEPIGNSPILAVGLVQIGIRCYDGNYWGNAGRELNIALDAQKQRFLGLSFIETLKAHGKCILSEKDRVDSILFHSFVSNYYSKGLFEFLFQYFNRDLERDIHRNTTEQMQELMNTIAVKAQMDEKLSDQYTEQFESKGSQAYKLRHHTLDAIAANPRHSKLRLHRIIHMIDKAFWKDYLPENPVSRLSVLFKEWVADSESFGQEYRLYKKGEVKNKGKKHFSSPYLFADIKDSIFSLKLPSQLVKDEFGLDLRWEISTSERNVFLNTRSTQAVTGFKTGEQSLPLNENELFGRVECRLMSGDTLVRRLADIPASSVRFFDMDGDYAGRLFKIPMCAYTPLSMQLKSLALIDSMPLGRLIRWDFEFEDGDIVLLPDESSMIVGECYTEGLLPRKSVGNAHYKSDGNVVDVFSAAPELLLLIPKSKLEGSVLDVNSSRKRLSECKCLQFDSKDSRGEKATLLSLEQFKAQLFDGINRVILDEPGNTYAKEYRFFLADGFSATFDGAPYVFDDRGVVTFPNNIIVDTCENTAKLPDDNSFSFSISSDTDSLPVFLCKEHLPIELDIPVFMWSIDEKTWNTAPMGDIWHTKFPNKIFVKSPSPKVELGVDLDVADDADYDLHSVKAEAYQGKIMCVDLTRFKSWFSRDEFFYNIILKIGGTEYSFGKVYTKSYVASCAVSADFENNIITCAADIIGDANHFISVTNEKSGELIADKLPITGEKLSIQAKRLNGKYLVELFEAEDDDSGFGDFEFYTIYSHSEEMLNKDDLSGKHVHIMMFRPVSHSVIYTKFAYDYWICNLEKIGALEYEGELFENKTPCGLKVRVWFVSRDDLRYFYMSFWDDEYEEYNAFIYDRDAKALVRDDDPTLKHAERFRRYRELYDCDYVYYGSLSDSFSEHEESRR